jgi:spermidine/putrescine transport system permease protein
MLENWRLHRRLFASVALPPVGWLFLFFILPLGIVWLYSFGTATSSTQVAISGTFANYARALDPLYLRIFGKSLAIAALTTVLCLIIGFPVALAIVFAPARWRGWLLMAVMLPFWTNLLIRTYALIAVLRTQGTVNAVLGSFWGGLSQMKTAFGLAPLPTWEPLELLFNNSAVVVGLVYVHLPFMVLPLYAALDRLDRSLIEASLDLGAGHLQTFNRIIVPLASPGIWSGIVITFGNPPSIQPNLIPL